MKAMFSKVVLSAGLFLLVLAPLRTFAQSTSFEFRSSSNSYSNPVQRGRGSTYHSRPGTTIGVSISSGPNYSSQRDCYPYNSRPVYVAPPPVVYMPPPVVYTAPPVYYGNVVPQPSYELAPPPPPLPVAPAVDARLVQVQDNLRRLGYYNGQVDGLNGTGTRNAIRSYQMDRGLPVTGRVDQELLRDLGL